MAVIDENVAKIAEASQLSGAELEAIRSNGYAQLNKFQGIEDASVITEMEIAEIQSTMTADNFMFMLLQVNMDWYKLALRGACYTPIMRQAGCMVWTVICTPFAIVGDLILLPFTFTASAV